VASVVIVRGTNLRRIFGKTQTLFWRCSPKCGEWDPRKDTKLRLLEELIVKSHPKEKVLVFSQFADTVEYLLKELEARGVDSHRWRRPATLPTRRCLLGALVRAQTTKVGKNLRGGGAAVLISTDVLSEGQNLQDCLNNREL